VARIAGEEPRRSGEPIRPPDIAELETLVACATDGSLSAAAERLGISRPAVAKRIANLEALAGEPLLDRGARGVTLTDTGAAVVAGARRLLEERDVLVAVLTDIRAGRPSSISGLRALLGSGGTAYRAGHLTETRLADAERLLELIFRSTASGIVVTNLETGVVYEANEAFCRFTGRTREQLVGQRASTRTTWYSSAERRQAIDEIRRTGFVEGFPSEIVRPDGSVFRGTATTYLVSMGGEAVLLGIVEEGRKA
jgi:PAS domain S-box-containing protein